MKCVACGHDCLESESRCRYCGAQPSVSCPECGFRAGRDDSFCGRCGRRLAGQIPSPTESDSLLGEKKQVSVLFCDLCGYAGIAERLDPERLRDIITRIFGEIARIVAKYEGHVQKFIGDAAMVLFGLPAVHEDDAVRAIRAALDIHEMVRGLSTTLDDEVGRPLAMHTGVSTGLVVAGPSDTETETILGDAVNLASRLSDLASDGEILVAQQTFDQVRGLFDFESLGPLRIEGKRDPIVAHRVLAARKSPVKVHRLAGLRADLIGRDAELEQLRDAAACLNAGKGAIIAICGEAGTGKSRLVQEFRRGLRDDTTQWHEAHCYAYSQNIPYAPLIDLLSRAWRISEDDPPAEVRRKIEENIGRLLGDGRETISYLGGLFGLEYAEAQRADPEFWRSRLFEAVATVLRALVQQRPTIFLLEDIHWADPSSQDLLRSILGRARGQALVLCTCRPPCNPLSANGPEAGDGRYREIELKPLSTSESEAMLKSLLDTPSVPPELNRFVQDKAEGNPFYLEEAVNALIDAGTLVRRDEEWKLARAISEFDVPLTINGVIADRIDRLDSRTKRVLQEAAVVGRTFPLEILRRTSTSREEDLEGDVGELVGLGLLRLRSHGQDVECSFKHALTQEVVYASLLKGERQSLHERVGAAMEESLRDRLPEFCESLAFHFKRGRSLDKAVRYLVMSGQKNLARYAVAESHTYFEEAFEILRAKPGKSREEEELLIDLVMAWANVFWYRGAFRDLEGLLASHQDLAESLQDPKRLGMFYGYRGMAAWPREELADASRYLKRSIDLARQVEDGRTLAYSATFLAYACADSGNIQEAQTYAQLASDLVFDESRLTVGYVTWVKGEVEPTLSNGVELIKWGREHSSLRAVTEGNWLAGCGHMNDGDFELAIERFRQAVQISVDPFYAQFPRLLLAMMYMLTDQTEQAEPILETILDFNEEFGAEGVGVSAKAMLGLCLISRGSAVEGSRMIGAARRFWLDKGAKWRYLLGEMLHGYVLMRNVERRGRPGGRTASLGPDAEPELPDAVPEARAHFEAAVRLAEEMDARAMLGKAHFGLARLDALEGDSAQAKEHLRTSMRLL